MWAHVLCVYGGCEDAVCVEAQPPCFLKHSLIGLELVIRLGLLACSPKSPPVLCISRAGITSINHCAKHLHLGPGGQTYLVILV